VNKYIFEGRFEDILRKLNECEIWTNRFYRAVEEDWDLTQPFVYLRKNTQELIYMFSDLFKRYCDDTDKKQALDEDLKAFVTYIFSMNIARSLNDPHHLKGDLINAVAQIQQFLEYVKVIFKSIISDVEEYIPEKLVEHALRNAGLVPKFEELKKIAKREEDVWESK